MAKLCWSINEWLWKKTYGKWKTNCGKWKTNCGNSQCNKFRYCPTGIGQYGRSNIQSLNMDAILLMCFCDRNIVTKVFFITNKIRNVCYLQFHWLRCDNKWESFDKDNLFNRRSRNSINLYLSITAWLKIWLISSRSCWLCSVMRIGLFSMQSKEERSFSSNWFKSTNKANDLYIVIDRFARAEYQWKNLHYHFVLMRRERHESKSMWDMTLISCQLILSTW